MNKIRCFIFLLILGCSVIYPLRKILFYEYPAVEPSLFLFHCGAFDPYIRGRYLALHPLPDSVELPQSENIPEAKYAVLAKDSEGYAVVKDIVAVPPSDGSVYLRIKYHGIYREWNKSKKKNCYRHHFSLPFTRYYLDARPSGTTQPVLKKKNTGCTLRIKIYSDGSYLADGITFDETIPK